MEPGTFHIIGIHQPLNVTLSRFIRNTCDSGDILHRPTRTLDSGNPPKASVAFSILQTPLDGSIKPIPAGFDIPTQYEHPQICADGIPFFPSARPHDLKEINLRKRLLSQRARQSPYCRRHFIHAYFPSRLIAFLTSSASTASCPNACAADSMESIRLWTLRKFPLASAWIRAHASGVRFNSAAFLA